MTKVARLRKAMADYTVLDTAKVGGFYVELVRITPDQAQAILAKQPEGEERINRRLSQHSVRRIAHSLEKGHWQLNGETLVFDGSDKLLDGQHRLAGCIKAETSFETMVIRGVPQDAFQTLDSGKPRSIADAYGIQGIPNAALMAATLGKIYIWENFGEMKDRRRMHIRPDKGDLDVVLELYPEVEVSVKQSEKWRRDGHCKELGLTPSMAAFTHWLLTKNRPRLAPVFLEQFVEGIDVARHTPTYALRRAFINAIGDNVGYRGKVALRVTDRIGMHLIIKAWRMHLKGEPCKVLKIGKVEEFPKLP